VSGYHFFVEINGGQWHRTETRCPPAAPAIIPPVIGPVATCTCGIATNDTRVLKIRLDDDDSWQWVPDSQLGRCFPDHMRTKQTKRDGAVDRSGPRAPKIDERGIPMCGLTSCPKYARFIDRCTEDNADAPRVCLPAVQDAMLELDAYPGQVVRDVADALKQRDKEIADLKKDRAEWQELCSAMRTCIVYARDRRGGMFDFDEWSKMVEHALHAGQPPPCALENAQVKEAQAWAAVDGMRKERDAKIAEVRSERDKDLIVMSRQGKVIEELRDKLRIAEAVRDDARAASQRYLDEKRELERSLSHYVYSETHPARTQCKWMLPDGDPDEGNWHCKLEEEHAERHVTEFGRGENERWYLLCEGDAHTFVGDCCRDCGLPVTLPDCTCSYVYSELKPGVHAKYCPLAGKPT
jgi:hypothetical protein